MKKYIGFALWALALALPFRFAMLSTSGVSNVVGLISFLGFMVLVFVGYALVDSGSSPAQNEQHH